MKQKGNKNSGNGTKVLRWKAVACLLAGTLFFCLDVGAVYGAETAGGKGRITVVLDPGHGGENLGGEWEKYTEKNLTVITARAMKEELEKYEGISVYMTREEDKDISLEERVKYAKSVQADFLFCLHFNMSLNHSLFGAEVWVSAFGEQYRSGYTFAGVEMGLLEELGLYSRGIKTRLNDGGEDYYGIIRHATEIHMPSVIIEHCHLDQENDREFFTPEEKLKELGRLDATAVAKYYGLRSEILGVDYSGGFNPEIPVPTAPVKPDKTEPDVCMIEVKEINEETGDITVELSAQDYDSPMLYYSYSYDAGENFSELFRWPEQGEDTVRFSIHVPSGTLPEIVVNAYNGFDLCTQSNQVSLPSLSYGEREAVAAGNLIRPEEDKAVREEYALLTQNGQSGENGSEEGDTQTQEAERKGGREPEKGKNRTTVYYFLEVCLISAAILFVLLLLARIVLLPFGSQNGKTGTGRQRASRSRKKRGRRK